MVQAAPTASSERVTNLDTVRGVAVLGILLMNSVSFGLNNAAYFNLDAGGSNTWLDWVVGVAGEVFVDQKTMGLFSMLFGAGIVLFADRAAMKGRGPVRLSLWRNLLLLAIGLLHGILWDGDVLAVYAICAPVLVATRRWSPTLLAVIGTLTVLLSAVGAVIAQTTIDPTGDGLGDYWLTEGGSMSDAVGVFLLADFFLRSLGMMWIGVALYRFEVMQGRRTTEWYRRVAVIGLGVGLPIAALGVVLQLVNKFSPAIAVIGEAPNTLATIPISMGYLALISLWNSRPTTWHHERVRAAGRMALTNYLTQTVIGITVLRVVFDRGELGRAGIFAVVLAIWIVQLAWSQPWLDRFRFGPAEWLWRCATYRSWQPLKRATASLPISGPSVNP